MENNQAIPKGIIQRGRKYRVSVMVEGTRQTATCKNLVEAISVLERFKRGLLTGHIVNYSTWNVSTAWDNYIRYRVEIAPNSTGNPKKFNWYGKMIMNYFGKVHVLCSITLHFTIFQHKKVVIL